MAAKARDIKLYTEQQIDTEKRNRIRVAVAAYAYVVEDDQIMTEADFDELSMSISPQMDTGNPLIDAFFADEFSTADATWVLRHPEYERVSHIYNRVWAGRMAKPNIPRDRAPVPVKLNTRSWMEDT